MTATSNARLMCSGMFGLASLSAPVTRATQDRLKFWSIAALLLEDVPQLVIQAIVIDHQGSFENTAALSMLVTVLMILLSLMLRLVQRFCPSLFFSGKSPNGGEAALEQELEELSGEDDDVDEDLIFREEPSPRLPEMIHPQQPISVEDIRPEWEDGPKSIISEQEEKTKADDLPSSLDATPQQPIIPPAPVRRYSFMML